MYTRLDLVYDRINAQLIALGGHMSVKEDIDIEQLVNLSDEFPCDAEGAVYREDLRPEGPCEQLAEWMIVKVCGHRRALCNEHLMMHDKASTRMLLDSERRLWMCSECGKLYLAGNVKKFPI